MKFGLIFFGIIVVFLVFRFLRLAERSQAGVPKGLGVKDGKLAPCGAKPNCVNTQGGEPLKFSGTIVEAKSKLKAEILNQFKSSLVNESKNYMHFEIKSGVFGFADDLELYFPPDEPGNLHVRSASREGYSDMGANRKRLAQIQDLVR